MVERHQSRDARQPLPAEAFKPYVEGLFNDIDPYLRAAGIRTQSPEGLVVREVAAQTLFLRDILMRASMDLNRVTGGPDDNPHRLIDSYASIIYSHSDKQPEITGVYIEETKWHHIDRDKDQVQDEGHLYQIVDPIDGTSLLLNESPGKRRPVVASALFDRYGKFHSGAIGEINGDRFVYTRGSASRWFRLGWRKFEEFTPTRKDHLTQGRIVYATLDRRISEFPQFPLFRNDRYMRYDLSILGGWSLLPLTTGELDAVIDPKGQVPVDLLLTTAFSRRLGLTVDGINGPIDERDIMGDLACGRDWVRRPFYIAKSDAVAQMIRRDMQATG